VRSKSAPKLSALTGPAGSLGEACGPDSLPAWAKQARNVLDQFASKYFDDFTGAWIWQANSHELIAMFEEARDLPDALWEKLVA